MRLLKAGGIVAGIAGEIVMTVLDIASGNWKILVRTFLANKSYTDQ